MSTFLLCSNTYLTQLQKPVNHVSNSHSNRLHGAHLELGISALSLANVVIELFRDSIFTRWGRRQDYFGRCKWSGRGSYPQLDPARYRSTRPFAHFLPWIKMRLGYDMEKWASTFFISLFRPWNMVNWAKQDPGFQSRDPRLTWRNNPAVSSASDRINTALSDLSASCRVGFWGRGFVQKDSSIFREIWLVARSEKRLIKTSGWTSICIMVVLL